MLFRSRISETPVTENRFEDVSPDKGNNYYMVRTLKLSHVTSGSYFNLSQGIFDTIRVEKQSLPSLETTASTVNTVNETVIYPNPSTGLFNISFGSNPVQRATLKIYDIQGKLLRETTYQDATLERFDISALPKGIYIVSGIIDDRKIVTKICLQ